MSTVSILLRAALCWSLVWLLAGCIDPYMPDAISTPRTYLVVDGFINSNGVTQIKLTRTYNLTAATAPPTETRATVYVEEEGGPRFQLREGTAGLYTSDRMTLNSSRRYRLRITTTGGKDYASAFVPVKTTPPIDSVRWEAAADGLNIYVTSHDDTRATQFYQWDYEETWQFSPLISPDLEYVNRRIQPIAVPFPHTCWVTTKSSAINQSKTTSLSRDLVSDYQLRKLATNSERLFIKYSILVKQYAQTREEHEYWELLKRNTENIGTLFDPLPSQLTGNIVCLNDDSELALGFIGAHTVSEKRIFIRRSQLPIDWRVQTGYESCIPMDTIRMIRDLHAVFGSGRVPVSQVPGGYVVSTLDCVDCRLRGTSVQPGFWQ